MIMSSSVRGSFHNVEKYLIKSNRISKEGVQVPVTYKSLQ